MIKTYLYALGSLPDGKVVRHVVACVDLDVLPPKGTTLRLPDDTRFLTSGDIDVDVSGHVYFLGGRPLPPRDGFDATSSFYEAIDASEERRRAGIPVRYS